MDLSLNGGQRQVSSNKSGETRGLRPKEVPALELERLREREDEDDAVITVHGNLSNLPTAMSWGTANPATSSPTCFSSKYGGVIDNTMGSNKRRDPQQCSFRGPILTRPLSDLGLNMNPPHLTSHSTAELNQTPKISVGTRTRKLEAEELTEERKKQAVIEQVMVDQLSRAVISDPEQNAIKKTVHSHNRSLHHTMVKTQKSLTEKLLSYKLSFHARILSRWGREACRELFGFYFACDHTLTVYEYRNFGKNRSNALPFIARGVYRTRGRPYCLADLSQGADLCFPANGPHLPESLRRQPYLTLRVTAVDEEIKRSLLAQCGETEFSLSEEEVSNRKTLRAIQGAVQDRLRGRAVQTLIRLGRSLDVKGNGLMCKGMLKRNLVEELGLMQQELEVVWSIVGQQGELSVDYAVMMRAVTGEMCETRKAVFLKVYIKLDPNKTGSVSMTDIEKFYLGRQFLHMEHGPKTDFLTCIRDTERASKDVTYAEFEDYYEGLSIEIPNDDMYINVLRTTWSI